MLLTWHRLGQRFHKVQEQVENLEPIRIVGLCFNFWQLVANSAEEMVRLGNQASLQYEGLDNPSRSEFENHIKWSDSRVAEPVLFNFYHGIELSLKALIAAKGQESPGIHKLSELAQSVAELYNDSSLNDFYSKYIETPRLHVILREFCQNSKSDMDLFYQSFKYPSSRQGITFNHPALHSRLEEGLELFAGIKRDIELMKPIIERYIVVECQVS